MNHNQGIIFRIKKFAIHDGPGIRTTIFLKGCPLSCWWCHNPEGQKYEPEIMIKSKNDTLEKNMIGKISTIDELINEIEKDTIFYDESNGGVTFSGGEPLAQAGFLKLMIQECKKRDLHTTIDTSGFTSERVIQEISKLANLILFDLKLMDNKDHKKYTGVSNIQILNNLKKICEDHKKVKIRFPVIPGITNTQENMSELVRFLNQFKNIREVDILPFHDIAVEKYNCLGMKNKMQNIKPPQEDEINRIIDYFKDHGFYASAGG